MKSISVFLLVLVLVLGGCVSFAKACGWIDLDNVELGMTFTEVMEHGPNPQDITTSYSDQYNVTIYYYEIATLVFVNHRLTEIIY